MKISPSQVQEVVRSYLRGLPAAGTRVAREQPRKADAVRLSDHARQVAAWVQRVQNLPEIRSETVERIKTAIAKGDYSPSDERVAEKILQRLIADRAIEEQG